MGGVSIQQTSSGPKYFKIIAIALRSRIGGVSWQAGGWRIPQDEAS